MNKLSPELQALVGRAMIDVTFREALMSNVRGTLVTEGIKLDDVTIHAIEQVVSDRKAAALGQQFDEMVMHRAAHAA